MRQYSRYFANAIIRSSLDIPAYDFEFWRHLQTLSSLSVVVRISLSPPTEARISLPNVTDPTRTQEQDPTQEPRPDPRTRTASALLVRRPSAIHFSELMCSVDQPLDTLFAALLLIQLACLPTLYSSSYMVAINACQYVHLTIQCPTQWAN